jgi:hypothetical protein
LKTTIFTLFLAAFVAFAACKKDEPTTPPVTPPTKKEMISRTWKVETMTVNQMPFPDSFFVDNRLTFKTDGTYSTFDGTDTETGTWEFSTDETKVIMDKGTSDEETMDIVELSSTKLHVKQTSDGNTIEMKLIPA